MAKNYKEDIKVSNLIEQYQRGYDSLSLLREEFSEKEAMLLGKTEDSQTKVSKSKVYDPRLSTYIFERASRVMAQNPTGRVQTFSKDDRGKNAMFNLLLKNYVVPNGNSQYDFLTKTRMWDVYSNVYGSFAVQIDWVVRDDYVGPDFYLVPMRNVVFQEGVSAFNDSDYVFVRSKVSRKWLLSRDTKNWKNIDQLLEKAYKPVREERSYTEEKYENDAFIGAKEDDQGTIDIISKFEGDKWTTFSKDAKVIIREIDNPQKNGKLPIVLKHCFPLIDRVIGLGDMERLKTLQFSINSLINLYMDGVKMSIFPPLMINPSGVVARSLTYEAGAKWFLKQQGAVQQLQLSPLGLNTFQQTYAFLNSAILNGLGTTDVATTDKTDPAMGKTPQGLSMLAQRENSRDSWDRFMLEQALEQVLDRFVDLISKRQEKPIKAYFSEDDLKLIAQVNPDVVEMFDSGKYGELIIKPSDVKNSNCRFFIDSGSTMKKDDMQENETLTSILGFVLKMPGAIDQIMQTGKIQFGRITVNFGELFKRWVITSGTQDWDKIVSEDEQTGGINFEDPIMQQMLQTFSPDLQQVAGQLFNGQQAQNIPQQGAPTAPIGQPATAGNPVGSGVQAY